ncbi:MAG TPA: hopanoid biosynthesis-associated protein HpnK [Stellaceae bacterium]|nr:hopanoid biosynthesis-associated protein HpnK [Stellaceae bacterium]
MATLRQLIVCADDFGRDLAVNAAVEQAHRDGILTTASLMVGAPGAGDAVARARLLPALGVGLHLVLADGAPVLPASAVPALVGGDGKFDPNMVRAGFRFYFSPAARRQLAAEIRAQFEAFRATGLPLDHINGHKHIHLHPTVGRLVVAIGGDYGLRAVRLPDEPAEPLRRAFPDEPRRAPAWSPVIASLRRRLDRAGLMRNEQVFGLAWSGAMVEHRWLALLPHLPGGVSEIYCHPASGASASVPGYRQAEELAALVSPRVRRLVEELGLGLARYRDLAR